MLRTIRTAMLALALAIGGSVLLGGTAQASAPSQVGVWQSATTTCGTPFTLSWFMCISSNTGSTHTATTATNNCVNFNTSCTATAGRP
jgi:hypothetical protein